MIKGPLFLKSSILGVKCSNLTSDARGARYARCALSARSLIGENHVYFGLLARSFRKFYISTHQRRLKDPARSLVGKY